MVNSVMLAKDGAPVRLTRRMVIALPALIAAGSAHAATYPVKQATIVVPYAAGGTADILARMIAKELQARLSVTVIIENKGGAAGTIGCAAVAKAASDGATLLFTAGGPLTIGPNLTKTAPYAAARDFTPLALVCDVPSLLVVNASDPAKTAMDLIRRGKNDALRFGSPGVGTSVHLIAELFRLQVGFEAIHVPYRGGALAMNDLISGQINYMFENAPQLLPQVQGGTLRALAVTSATRLASLPDVPTLKEAGVSGVEVGTWYGLLGPKDLAPPAATLLTDAMTEACRSPALISRLSEQGAQMDLRTGQDFISFISNDDRRWRDTIARANIKVE